MSTHLNLHVLPAALLGDLLSDTLLVHATVDLGPGNLAGVLALEEEGLGLGAREAEGLNVSWRPSVDDSETSVSASTIGAQARFPATAHGDCPRMIKIFALLKSFVPVELALRPLFFVSPLRISHSNDLRFAVPSAAACSCHARLPVVDDPIPSLLRFMIDSHLGVTTDVDLTPGGVNLEAGPVATIDTHSAALATVWTPSMSTPRSCRPVCLNETRDTKFRSSIVRSLVPSNS